MNNIKLLLLLCFSLLLTNISLAQIKDISGTVFSKSDKQPLPGVGIVIKGTLKGTETNFDGKYNIKASVGDVLVFSFVGMKTIERVVTNNISNINIQLQDNNVLKEVVITALGIKKEKKSLTYSSQQIKGDELSKIKQTNPINSLSGKSAGISITRSSSGAGGSSKVVLRGNSSTTNNDPLYVIDGIPMLNNGNGKKGGSDEKGIFGSFIGNRDGGDALSLINPDDIESINVLKGASAAALYGSQGANGVILITTKSGKEGKVNVHFNSSSTIDNVISLPKLQTEYQSNSVGSAIKENGNVTDPKSWGAKKSGLTNTVGDFFNTGYTSIQSLSLSAGNKKAQTYFSFSNTSAKGVIPENSLSKNTLSLKETASFLGDRIKVVANVNLSDQKIHNRPTSGLYSNILSGLYLNPVGIDLNIYKNKFEFNTKNNMMDQYATSFDQQMQQNPYWLIYRNPTEDKAQRVLAAASVNYKITDHLSIQSRGSFDKTFFTFDKRMFAGSDGSFIPKLKGRYILEKTENTQKYIDLIATYTNKFYNNFDLTAILGSSLTKYEVDRITLDSGASEGLKLPNFFTIGNFVGTNGIGQTEKNREVQSVFGSISIGYKDMLFVDATGRKDWSSTLVNTNSLSFFYPSVGLTGVLSQMFTMPNFISFAKIRASYAEVGKDIPIYATVPRNTIPLGQGNFAKPVFGVKQGATLEPEKQASYEFGTEWRFLKNRLGFDFTYYNTNTTNQIFFIQAEPNPNGYVQNIVNAGKITNKGIELVIDGQPIRTDDFKWNTAFNFASNKNKVVSVDPSLKNGTAVITQPGSNGYGFNLVEGEDFGSITGQSVKRNKDGLPIVTITPNPKNPKNPSIIVQRSDFHTIAHAQPDFTLGWNNTFEYKNFTVHFLIDSKFGGNVVSVTEAVNDFYGVSQATADARNKNGGMINVVQEKIDPTTKAKSYIPSKITAEEYYTKVAGRNGALNEYVYDATNIRLAELSLGYTIPVKSNFFKKVKLSLIANNLFFFYKQAPFDPNITTSTGIGLQGVDIYGQPATKSIGLNLNLNF